MSDKKSEEKIDINNINNQREINELPREREKREKNPKMNIKKISNLSESIVNYIGIAVCLFLNSAYNLEWFNLQKHQSFLFSYFLFAAVLLYIIGIMNWYEGKDLLFLFNFILCFYFLVLFFNNVSVSIISFNDISKTIINTSLDNVKLQAMFYIIIFCLFFVLGLSSSSKKGIVFIINYFILFVAFAFLFFDYYYEHKHSWMKKVHSYSFIVSGCFMWLIGIIKFINYAFLTKQTTKLLGNSD